MASSYKITSGSLSVTGNYRDNNEDNCLVDTTGRFFLVADGMGGQSAGEKASELAIELVSEKLRAAVNFDQDAPTEITKAIDAAVSYANMEIMALGELDSKYRSMGTTIAFVVAAGGALFVGGVGDSRVYLLRQGTIEQLTKDHSLTQALVDAGTITQADAATHRYKNVLYRYLGTKEGSNGTEAQRIEPQPGDRLLICSDGVTDGIGRDEIAQILATAPDPQSAAEIVVESALNAGSRDNVTSVVIHVD